MFLRDLRPLSDNTPQFSRQAQDSRPLENIHKLSAPHHVPPEPFDPQTSGAQVEPLNPWATPFEVFWFNPIGAIISHLSPSAPGPRAPTKYPLNADPASRACNSLHEKCCATRSVLTSTKCDKFQVTTDTKRVLPHLGVFKQKMFKTNK